ncbi:glycoside hydrolase family 43 protein [Bacteroides sp. 224]|uniref:glycoside hydrolase family 43 protein n=1 Tax=Bacteroides sp. 224 TaxID=2302936 RepID=UPI0013D471C0|nr:glycoside hydrolase family 43 protein [Bacteroides sp. 224]NDV64058.1 arabinosidase [Bacteroides sp. 224]
MKESLKLLGLLFLIVLASCKSAEKEYYVFTSFHEPADEGLRFLYSEDGLHWDSIPGIWLKPELGSHKIMRDPSMVRTPDGTFHLVWTSSWNGDLGFGYANTKDLKNWSEQQFIPAMKHEPTTVNTWAPEIYYDDEKEEFIVVWASCVPGRFERGIEDEKNNHRLYYLTTKDFKTISETKLFYDPGFSVIDAVIVKRAKEDYVLVHKDNTRPNRNLKVAFGKTPIGPYSEASEPFTEEFVEGPSVVKLGDEYYIYFDAYREKVYDAVKTKDFINFTSATKEISVPKLHKHGTIFKASKKVIDSLSPTLSKGEGSNHAD